MVDSVSMEKEVQCVNHPIDGVAGLMNREDDRLPLMSKSEREHKYLTHFLRRHSKMVKS